MQNYIDTDCASIKKTGTLNTIVTYFFLVVGFVLRGTFWVLCQVFSLLWIFLGGMLLGLGVANIIDRE